MTDAERTQDRATSTEQIAAAGTADSQDRTSPGQRPPGDGQAGAGRGPGWGDQPPAQLLAVDELQSIQARWKDIQAEFVDEPRTAVQNADALVADLM